MLGHGDGDHRQLFDLMTRRLPGADAIAVSQHMPAAATRRPVLDNLIDRPRRQQRTALALMTGLRARLSPRGVLAAPRRRARPIGARRLRRVTRRALGRALELRDPLVLTRDPRRQLLDLRLKPRVLRRQRKQHIDDDVAAPVIDRLSLTALHTTTFDTAALCPPDRLNAYAKPRLSRYFVSAMNARDLPFRALFGMVRKGSSVQVRQRLAEPHPRICTLSLPPLDI